MVSREDMTAVNTSFFLEATSVQVTVQVEDMTDVNTSCFEVHCASVTVDCAAHHTVQVEDLAAVPPLF